jgi:uncharacterized membrane protein
MMKKIFTAYCLIVLAASAQGQTHYIAKPVKDLSGIYEVYGSSIANDGTVAGTFATDPSTYTDVGFATKPKGKGAKPLAALAQSGVYNLCLNNIGQLVGTTWDSRAFAIDLSSNTVTDLTPIFSGIPYLSCLNDMDQATGNIYDENLGIAQGFVLNLATHVVTILANDLGQNVIPIEINENGTVVGSMYPPPSTKQIRAFISNPPYTKLVDIQPPNAATSRAFAVNKHKQTVGYYTDVTTRIQRAFITDGGKNSRDLGTPAGFYSYAWDISDKGVVVGDFSDPVSGKAGGYRCSADCSDFLDLSSATELPEGVVIQGATAVNKKGQIVVNTNAGVYVLTPAE